MLRYLFYIPEEIEGREISARFRQGQLYIPRFYKDMFDINEGDYFILKVINRSHAKMKHKPIQKVDKPEKIDKLQKEDSKVLADPYAKPFKFSDKDDDINWEEEE